MEIVKGQICFGLIETWDVLKFGMPEIDLQRIDGLIETWDVLKSLYLCRNLIRSSINRNMGCIEMIREIRMISHLGLIETWDVLK